MSKKRVAFEYFDVVAYDEKGKESVYDLTTYFETVKKLGPKRTTKDFRGEKARVQKSQKLSKEWEAMFVRLRTSVLPGIADDDGDFEMIKVEDGKYIGEFSSVIYEFNKDKGTSVIVLHRNSHAFTPSALELYINKGTKQEIYLVPIIGKSRLSRIKKAKILRSIEIGVREDTYMSLKGNNSSVIQVLKNIDFFGGHKLVFKVSMGHTKRDKTLNLKKTVDVITEAYGLNDLDVLKVGYVEDNKIENVDLLEDRVVDYRDITYDNDNPLDHDRIFDKMLEVYRNRRDSNKLH